MKQSEYFPKRKITTYPEMNEEIKNLLRMSDEPLDLYTAVRLEELETQLRKAIEDLDRACGMIPTSARCKFCRHGGNCSPQKQGACQDLSEWEWRGEEE